MSAAEAEEAEVGAAVEHEDARAVRVEPHRLLPGSVFVWTSWSLGRCLRKEEFVFSKDEEIIYVDDHHSCQFPVKNWNKSRFKKFKKGAHSVVENEDKMRPSRS